MGSGRAASTLEVIEHFGEHPSVVNSRLESRGRRSFLLEWQTPDGFFRGEASPLPGYGTDDPERAHRELGTVEPGALENRRAERRGIAVTLEELEQLPVAVSSPSARFALETAWLRARSFDLGLPVWQLLRRAMGLDESRAPETIRTSAVLDAGAAAELERARSLFHDGIRTFKVKCGRDWPAEKRLIEALSELGAVRLRLDPNLAWSPEELRRAQAELSLSLPIEFIEDPTPDQGAWDPALGFAFGIDEPLGALTPSPEALSRSGARFVVLKPMALGGFARSLRWAQAAFDCDASCIVSHLFDGPTALDAAIELAFAVQSPDHAAGLGAHLGLLAFSEKPRFLEKTHLIRPVLPPGTRSLAGSAPPRL